MSVDPDAVSSAWNCLDWELSDKVSFLSSWCITRPTSCNVLKELIQVYHNHLNSLCVTDLFAVSIGHIAVEVIV